MLSCREGRVSLCRSIDTLTMKFQPFYSGSGTVTTEDVEDEAEKDDASVVDQAEE